MSGVGTPTSIFALEGTHPTIFTARCYAERANATVDCLSGGLSVRPSVCDVQVYRAT